MIVGYTCFHQSSISGLVVLSNHASHAFVYSFWPSEQNQGSQDLQFTAVSIH